MKFFSEEALRRTFYGEDAAEIDMPFSFVYDGAPSAELSLNWTLDSKEPGNGKTVYCLKAEIPNAQITVEALATVYTCPLAADFILYFQNNGNKESGVLSNIRAFDFCTQLPQEGRSVVLHLLRGSAFKEDDWEPYEQLVAAPHTTNQSFNTPSAFKFGCAYGKSAYGMSPFFNVGWAGGGMICAVGWSGQWNAAVAIDESRRFTLNIGMEDCHFVLYPGERVRSPRIAMLRWEGSEADSYNAFRDLMRRHIGRKIDGAAPVPPIAHMTNAGDMPNPNLTGADDVIAHFEAVKDCGFEVLWLDAYFHDGGFPNGIGNMGFPVDRVVDKKRYPNGIRPISDYAHAHNAKFLLWFEPERVAEGTLLTKEHPEWLIADDNTARPNIAIPGYMFNLGDPDACAFITRYIKESIEQFGIDLLRIDFNYFPLSYWRYNDQKNGGERRRGISEIRYVEGLYCMWDTLLDNFPRLVIDNCASGGMRIDLETCARSFPLWRSDAAGYPVPISDSDFEQVAIQNQLMTLGLNRYVPYSVSGMKGSTPYYFRSGFNGGVSFYEDCRVPGYPLAELKAAIAEGKRLRPYYAGDFYALTPETGLSHETWCVTQYHLPSEDRGLVVAFRRGRSPYREFVCSLNAVDESGKYRVSISETFQREPCRSMSGGELKRITLRLGDPQSSLVLEYEKL